MTRMFDPVGLRKRWCKRELKFLRDLNLLNVADSARIHFSELFIADLIEAYLVGLAGPVDECLRRQWAGMMSVPEPKRPPHETSPDREEWWWARIYEWRQLLGLCGWLAGDAADRHLGDAMRADIQAMRCYLRGYEPRLDRPQDLTIRLATALAGNVPELGLHILEEGGSIRVPNALKPLMTFGSWACNHLAAGGRRDIEFVAKGKSALTKTLLPVLLLNSRKTEVGLWLKAVFFDSGTVSTAEQALLMAYDCMPGVPRPDFLEGHCGS